MGTKMACVRLVSHFFLHLTSFFFFFSVCLSLSRWKARRETERTGHSLMDGCMAGFIDLASHS